MVASPAVVGRRLRQMLSKRRSSRLDKELRRKSLSESSSCNHISNGEWEQPKFGWKKKQSKEGWEGDSLVSWARMRRPVIYVKEQKDRCRQRGLMKKRTGKGYTTWSSTGRGPHYAHAHAASVQRPSPEFRVHQSAPSWNGWSYLRNQEHKDWELVSKKLIKSSGFDTMTTPISL